jgi:hypothetical protein
MVKMENFCMVYDNVTAYPCEKCNACSIETCIAIRIRQHDVSTTLNSDDVHKLGLWAAMTTATHGPATMRCLCALAGITHGVAARSTSFQHHEENLEQDPAAKCSTRGNCSAGGSFHLSEAVATDQAFLVPTLSFPPPSVPSDRCLLKYCKCVCRTCRYVTGRISRRRLAVLLQLPFYLSSQSEFPGHGEQI